MWDNHQALDLISNVLIVAAALTSAYYISQWAVNLPVFPFKQIDISGSDGAGGKGGNGRNGSLRHVTREQIETVVRHEVKGNFFTVDLDALRNAFTKLPWVRTAAVRRIWPQSLEVTLEEHVALARWGSSATVNVHGELFHAVSDEKLPLFEGPGDSPLEMLRQHTVFSGLLQPLQQSIREIKLSPRRAWRLRLDNGTVVELGREQMEARLERYVLVYPRSSGQLNPQPGYVDLRYPNGFAVR
ncbi:MULTISPECIES: cell division protein FtsQ/DivIB [unclassified Nitrosospira]|uniref:cell division protein FtsQ/DivIB n=1 Tax=unclassified Nitrosospira TaxID=2609267 RepID=UPI000D325BDE|nr:MULTISPECIES: cell division protein FtsQ/DivIB [unclassified Nitrosospira]PTR15210.1 cell division protein FtsQ [Nitrosospira sp. Nsp2]WON72717.1 cell division protein FtsQ/DivIB [Nitrosospira sp. Is2]